MPTSSGLGFRVEFPNTSGALWMQPLGSGFSSFSTCPTQASSTTNSNPPCGFPYFLGSWQMNEAFRIVWLPFLWFSLKASKLLASYTCFGTGSFQENQIIPRLPESSVSVSMYLIHDWGNVRHVCLNNGGFPQSPPKANNLAFFVASFSIWIMELKQKHWFMFEKNTSKTQWSASFPHRLLNGIQAIVDLTRSAGNILQLDLAAMEPTARPRKILAGVATQAVPIDEVGKLGRSGDSLGNIWTIFMGTHWRIRMYGRLMPTKQGYIDGKCCHI